MDGSENTPEVVVIPGASAGVGRATARKFAGHGAHVWLIARGRDGLEAAREVFDRTLAAGNDLGLFSEEYDTGGSGLLGNFPQGLSHLSHITAALALADARSNG